MLRQHALLRRLGRWCHRNGCGVVLGIFPTQLLRRLWGWSKADGLLLRSRGSSAGRLRAVYPLLPTGNGECTHFCCFFCCWQRAFPRSTRGCQKERRPVSKSSPYPSFSCVFLLASFARRKLLRRPTVFAAALLLLLLLLPRPTEFGCCAAAAAAAAAAAKVLPLAPVRRAGPPPPLAAFKGRVPARGRTTGPPFGASSCLRQRAAPSAAAAGPEPRYFLSARPRGGGEPTHDYGSVVMTN